MSAKIFSMLAVLLLAGAAFASVNPKIQLVNYTLSEKPAEPGHTLMLKLQMKSVEYDNCADNVAVQVAVSYPLSLSGPDTKYLDSLCFQDPDSKGVFSFEVPVDNLASAGTYPVSVTTTYEKRFTKLSESNVVNVRVGGRPEFIASVSSSSPVDIYPGDSAQVTVTFQNTGGGMAQSARASASGSGIDVKWAGASQAIGQVNARGSTSAAFAIEAPKNLPAGNYPLSVKLDYSGEDRQDGSQTFSFSVPVKAKADFAGDSDGISLLAGEKKEVQIRIRNTGSDEARRLEIRLKPLFPFSTDGTVRYTDSLKPGEAKNLTYVITVDKEATAGQQLLGLLIDFEDAQGKKFSDSSDFAMEIRSPTLADDLLAYWYLVAIAIIAAFMLMKRRMQARHKQAHS